MKQLISRLSLVFLLLAVSLGSTTSQAQYRHRGHSAPRHTHRSTGDNVMRGIYTAQAVGQTARMGAALHAMADYTGLRVGYNSASLHFSDASSFDLDPLSGVNVGVVFGWYLGNTPLILEPGAFYSKKGGKFSGYDKAEKDHFSQKINMHMLEFPLNLKFELAAPNSPLRLQPFVGAYMAFGLGGQIKDSMDGNWDTFDTYDNFDAGFRFGCGLCFTNFYLEAAYDLGLTNMEDGHSYGSTHTRTLGISLGFNF